MVTTAQHKTGPWLGVGGGGRANQLWDGLLTTLAVGSETLKVELLEEN